MVKRKGGEGEWMMPQLFLVLVHSRRAQWTKLAEQVTKMAFWWI